MQQFPAAALDINSAILVSPRIQRLNGRDFKRKFYAAVAGELNEFSDFIRVARPRNDADYKALRMVVFRRDNFTCCYCGERGKRLECDHLYPVSRGGRNVLSNLVTACRDCNRSKRDKTLAEWLR